MNIKKTTLSLSILVAGVFGGLAIAQQDRAGQTNRPQLVVTAELERLSAQPSLEQTLLKIAADKLRQEKKPMTTLDLNLTVRVTKSAPGCWYDVCLIHAGDSGGCMKYFYCRVD